MGCFDTVIIQCPYCLEDTDLQSKSGSCSMEQYTVDTVPDNVMEDILKQPHRRICEHCEQEIQIMKMPKYHIFKGEK